MGCIVCSIGSFVSVILDALERISVWTICALVLCCLTFTIILVLLTGIGIGFHYCYVNYVGGKSGNLTDNSNFLYEALRGLFIQNIHTTRDVKGNGKIERLTKEVTRSPMFNIF